MSAEGGPDARGGLPGLQREFGITREDLVANQAGRLGPHQGDLLRRRSRQELGVLAMLLAALSFVILGLGDGPQAWWRYAIVLVVALVLVGVAVVEVRGQRRAVAAGVVEHHAGRVSVAFTGRSGLRLRVGGSDFRLPIGRRLIAEGDVYDVYVASGSVVALVPRA